MTDVDPMLLSVWLFFLFYLFACDQPLSAILFPAQMTYPPFIQTFLHLGLLSQAMVST